jgi:hypothetical protein
MLKIFMKQLTSRSSCLLFNASIVIEARVFPLINSAVSDPDLVSVSPKVLTNSASIPD